MKILKHIITVVVVVLSTIAYSQDGQALFEAKCNVCHLLEKNSTGPNLKGVKQKWADADESDLLYQWVQNPQTLIASGNSAMALEAEGFSAGSMTPQDLSNEEVDAILDYIDNYVPDVADENPPPTDGEVTVKIVPNYRKNLTLFYFLMVCVIIQIFAILIIAGSLKTFVRLDKNKKEGNSKTIKMILALVGLFGVIASTNVSHALTFVEAGNDPQAPWLLVENSDIYVLILINIILLLVLLHFRKLFMEIAEMIRPRTKRVSKRKQRRLNKMLTDVVPIEEEHTILLHHEYDGIKELDNNLPPWWVWGFYATIVFSVIYMFNYHVFNTGDLQAVEYEKSVAAAQIEIDAYLESQAMNVDENNVTLMTESSDLTAGKSIFETKCAACHGMEGEGISCPNLSDNTWIYGYDIKNVFTTIKYGTPNGMLEHGSILNPIQLQQVSSYVLSIPETDKGREPEGEIVEE